MTPEILSTHRGFFAPGGSLRACINLGNPVLATQSDAGSAPTGVSVDMATALAKLLDVPLEMNVVGNAAASVEAVRSGAADVGFFAVDPARGEGIRFTAPYVLIEGSYLVPSASALRQQDAVDEPGRRVAVGRGSAYDLFLSRALTSAHIVRMEGAAGVLQALRDGEADVAAGIRPVLEAETRSDPGLRMLPGAFMVIRQAMGLAASRGDDAAAALATFVRGQLISGFVQAALERHRITGGSAAPADE